MSNYPELAGRVAAITGAVGNLGTALVRKLSGEKMRLALIDRNADRARESARQLGLSEADTFAVSADLTKKADVEAAMQQIVAHYGRIDALVNVAGGWKPGKAVHELDEDGWDFMLNLNARSVFLMSGAAARAMIGQGGGGRIVTVSSRSAVRGEPHNGGYSAAKSAALRLTETLSAELLDRGITVNAVLPSVIDTPQNRQGSPDADFSKWVSPESLADAIAFLLSDGARDISGASIPVYGKS